MVLSVTPHRERERRERLGLACLCPLASLGGHELDPGSGRGPGCPGCLAVQGLGWPAAQCVAWGSFCLSDWGLQSWLPGLPNAGGLSDVTKKKKRKKKRKRETALVAQPLAYGAGTGKDARGHARVAFTPFQISPFETM